MKNLAAGIVAFGLIIWPIIALHSVWSDQAAYRARQSLEAPLALSWVLGSALAICGLVMRNDKAKELAFLGRLLCIGTLCLEVALVVYGLSQFSRLTSN